MSNDKAQELTAKISESITALCAETDAAEGGETLLPLLEKAAAQLNITLVYKAIAGSAEGYSKGGLIEIEETLDTPALCGVIAHEIGHELMHRTNREGTTRQQRELEASPTPETQGRTR
jgi:hypothetical protein